MSKTITIMRLRLLLKLGLVPSLSFISQCQSVHKARLLYFIYCWNKRTKNEWEWSFYTSRVRSSSFLSEVIFIFWVWSSSFLSENIIIFWWGHLHFVSGPLHFCVRSSSIFSKIVLVWFLCFGKKHLGPGMMVGRAVCGNTRTPLKHIPACRFDFYHSLPL